MLTDILDLCVSIDRKAASVYKNFSKTCDDQELRAFWKQKAEEEVGHLGLWRKLREFAKSGALPDVFDEPQRVTEELRTILSKIDVLFQQPSKESPDVTKSFLTALRLEFYALHPAFAILFRLVRDMQLGEFPEGHYEDHLKDFFEIIRRRDVLTPELEFISETIWHLWRENERLALESNTDGLTKILNRKGFFNAIKPLAYTAQRNRLAAALVMIDIDDFKKLNDTYGHQEGDKALALVASLLRKNIRKSDILGRYGGEEFCIFILYKDRRTLMKFAEKIRREIEDGTKTFLPLTVSIGIAAGRIGKDVEKEIDRLLSCADQCLYQAKDAGKNVVVLK